MIPRLEIHFDRDERRLFRKGDAALKGGDGKFLLNHARSGLQLALQALQLPSKSGVGMMVYNCHTVMNSICQAGYTPIFVDITDGMTIDMEDLARKRSQMQVLIVTHLFGIVNDIKAIKAKYPDLIIIEDCAHCFNHVIDGEMGVYSIGQGKFPAIGDGGILVVSPKLPTIDQKLIDGTKTQINTVPEINQKKYNENTEESSTDTDSILTSLDQQSANEQDSLLTSAQSCSTDTNSQCLSDDSSIKKPKNIFAEAISEMYNALPGYGRIGEMKLFMRLWIKAWMYKPGIYNLLTLRLKAKRMKELKNEGVKEEVVLRKMSRGIANILEEKRKHYAEAVAERIENARVMNERVKELESEGLIGENAFMLVVRTKDVAGLKEQFAAKGIETETHFAHCIDWAQQFGYELGSCPNAEKLVHELLMVPTYAKLKVKS